MATLSVGSNISSSSKLFGTQRRRTYRSDYGSYTSYESSSPRLEKSFSTKRYTASTSNGPSAASDYSPRYSSTLRRGTSVDRQMFSTPSGRRSSVSVDRDLDRHSRKPDALFSSASISTTSSTFRSRYSSKYESEPDFISSKPRRRYSVSVDRDDHTTAVPLFPQTRRKFTDVIDKQNERRQRELEERERRKLERQQQRDDAVRHIITRATKADDDYAGFDYRTMLDGIPKRQRSSSVSYGGDTDFRHADTSSARRSRYEYRPRSATRSSSLVRSYMTDAEDDYTSLHPRRRCTSVTPLDDVTRSDVDIARSSRVFKHQDYELSTKKKKVPTATLR